MPPPAKRGNDYVISFFVSGEWRAWVAGVIYMHVLLPGTRTRTGPVNINA